MLDLNKNKAVIEKLATFDELMQCPVDKFGTMLD